MGQSEPEIFYLTLEDGGRALEDRVLPPQVTRLSFYPPVSQAGLQDGPRLLRQLQGMLRDVQPEIVQAGPIQRSGLLVALAGFHPLISMSWGYDLLIDARRGRAWDWATRYTLRHSDALLGDCDTIRNLAIEYSMAPDRIVTFPWGVDLTHFTPALQAPQLLDGAPFTLLSTRSWEPIYGVDVLTQAFVLAARRRPELRLVMLGGGSQAGLVRKTLAGLGPHTDPGYGPSELLEQAPGHRQGTPGSEMAMARWADSELTVNRVSFPGQVSYRDLPRLYRRADLYVAASHSDGTSISLIEALACGVPALVSDIPGNREWIIPGENGWLFPDGDARAMAEGIIRALDERSRLAEMGRRARQVAESRADWNRNFPKLYELYDLARKRK